MVSGCLGLEKQKCFGSYLRWTRTKVFEFPQILLFLGQKETESTVPTRAVNYSTTKIPSIVSSR